MHNRNRHHKDTKKNPSGKSSRHFKQRHQKKPKHQSQSGGHKRDNRPGNGPSHGPSMTRLTGTIQKNQKGFAFFVPDSRQYEDAYIPKETAHRLFHGDRVNVLMSPRSGEVLEIKTINHRFREILGRFQSQRMGERLPKGAKGFLVYERKGGFEAIPLTEAPATVQDNDWILAKLEYHEGRTPPATGLVIAHFGGEIPAKADLTIISGEFAIEDKHPDAVIAEAVGLKLDVDEELRQNKGRRDLRQVPFITIDGETARDFDDAVYVEKAGDSFILWVAIADVSHYVREGGIIDKEAYFRATSVYFPEKAFHMLPTELSENLCSLKPKQPRLAFVAKMKLDSKGRKIDTEIMEAVIESKRRATYTEIQNEWNENKNNPQWEYKLHFELYHILRKMRTQRGSIDFDLPEAVVELDKDSEPVAIRISERVDAHRLIEEFMIAANEAVTEWAMKRGAPFIYRIHEAPDPKKFELFAKVAGTFGLRIDFDSEDLSPRTVSKIVDSFAKHPASALLSMSLLRSLKQARYEASHDIHFGLASQAYTHFTSPIRRYPDLIVHRLLKEALYPKMPKRKRDLPQNADHCSYRERLADQAENEMDRIKQARYMKRHLGEEFPGKIVGMTERGFFVQILDPYVEGFVPLDSLPEFYQFNEDKMILTASRSKQHFRLGDPVEIKVIRADIISRQIEFMLVGKKGLGK